MTFYPKVLFSNSLLQQLVPTFNFLTLYIMCIGCTKKCIVASFAVTSGLSDTLFDNVYSTLYYVKSIIPLVRKKSNMNFDQTINTELMMAK